MKTLGLFLCLLLLQSISAQWKDNKTPDYPTLIQNLKELDAKHREIELYAMGKSDVNNWPIYLCIVNGAGDSVSTFQKAKNSTTVLFNNAIHAGEPDGVNAMLIWLDQFIKSGKKCAELPVVAFIPAYNVGGMFNRSSTSRANQNGPEEYGFRGNAQNLDLNRDFIKQDAVNSKTFSFLYNALDPDVFVDNHVSNGADYFYTLTYIHSLKERMTPALKEITFQDFIPTITTNLAKQGTELFPYMELINEIPEEGIVAFNDLPRYAMGYAALRHSLSFTVETHMLKPFPERVIATLQFMDETIKYCFKSAQKIEVARKESIRYLDKLKELPFKYVRQDTSSSLPFKGFEATYETSEVTGLKRLYYDHKKPTSKNIPYHNFYKAERRLEIPNYYIVSPTELKIIEQLKQNGVEIKTIQKDTLVTVNEQVIKGFETGKRPYEGHYLHHSTQVEKRSKTVNIPAGSQLINTHQKLRNYIITVLNPENEDSFFNWNYFDSYIQEKEYFSPYVFEDIAAELLKNNPDLKRTLEEKRKTDVAFVNDSWAQLFFIYERSPYFESKTFNRLPIFEIME